MADETEVMGGFINIASQDRAKIDEFPNCCNWARGENSRASFCCNYVSGKNSESSFCCSGVYGDSSYSENCCALIFDDLVRVSDSCFLVAFEKFSIYQSEGLCCELASRDGRTSCCCPQKHQIIREKMKKPKTQTEPEQEKMNDGSGR